MKLKYLFSTLLASALLLVGCVQESIDSFEKIKLSKTYITIPVDGGTATLTVNSQDAWSFVETKDWPTFEAEGEDGKNIEKDAWLTVDKMSGAAGETVVTFTAGKTDTGREFELEIKMGNLSQYVRVRQGSMTAEEATCADVIAGPDGKTYIVQGVCTQITGDYYGNWYMNDGTGQIYIYGTVNEDGEYDWPSFNIEVGDSVKVEGPKATYKDEIELVGVSVIKVIKSLLKISSDPYMAETDGDTFEVKVAYKGKGVFYSIPEEYKSWISVTNTEFKNGTPSKLVPNPADTAIVTVQVLPNEGPSRSGAVEFSSSNGESTSVGLYNFSQAGLAPISDVLKSQKGAPAMVAGTVMAMHKNGYVVADNTGAIYIYQKPEEVAIGNNVVVGGTFDNYYGTLQLKDVTIKSNDKSTVAPTYPMAINLEYPDDYDAFKTFSSDNPVIFDYVKIRGKFVIESGEYTDYYIEVGESEKKTMLYRTSNAETGKYADLNNKIVEVYAYMYGYHSSDKYYQVIETSVKEVSGELPSLTITPIEDVVAGDTEYTVEGIVVAAEAQAYVIADETGNLLVYGKDHGRKLMEKVRVTGTASRFQGYSTNTMQLNAKDTDYVSYGQEWIYNPDDLTAEELDAKIGKDSIAEEVSVTGTLEISNNQYANITVKDAENQASLKYVNVSDYAKFDGKEIVLKGYVMGTHQRLSILPYSVEEVVSE